MDFPQFDELIPLYFVGKKWKIPNSCRYADTIKEADIVCRGDGWERIEPKMLHDEKPRVNSTWALGLALEHVHQEKQKREGCRGAYIRGRVTPAIVRDIRAKCDAAKEIGRTEYTEMISQMAEKHQILRRSVQRIAGRLTYLDDSAKNNDTKIYRRRFTDDEVRKMRRLREEGLSFSQICNRFGSSLNSVYDIIKGKTYKDVE